MGKYPSLWWNTLRSYVLIRLSGAALFCFVIGVQLASAQGYGLAVGRSLALLLGLGASLGLLFCLYPERWRANLLASALFAFVSAASFFALVRSSPSVADLGVYTNSGIIFSSRNNPYLSGRQVIRSLLRDSSSADDFWGKICKHYELSCSTVSDDLLRDGMLIAASLYDYGNARPLSGTGCVLQSEETGYRRLPPSWNRYREATVGCCSDYAVMLASFLDYIGVDNKYVYAPGHVFNAAFHGGRVVLLDANASLVAFAELDVVDSERLRVKNISIYPNPNVSPQSGRYYVRGFQERAIRYLAGSLSRFRIASTASMSPSFYLK